MGGVLRPKWDEALYSWPHADDVEVVELDEGQLAEMQRAAAREPAPGSSSVSFDGADATEDEESPPRCGADGEWVDAVSSAATSPVATPRTAVSYSRRPSSAVSQQHKRVRVVDADVDDNRLGDIGALFADGIEDLSMSRCNVPCLRDIGTRYANLRTLSLVNCGLKGVEGCYALRNVEELFLAFNQIADLTDIGGLGRLGVLDLEGNDLASFAAVQALMECESLRHLTLAGCPVDATEGYRGGVGHLLPQLMTLDDRPVAADRTVTDPYRFTLAPTLPPPPELDLAQLTGQIASALDGRRDDAVTAEDLNAAIHDDPEADYRVVLHFIKRQRRAEPARGHGATSSSCLTSHTQEVLCGKPTRRLRGIKEEQSVQSGREGRACW